MPRAEQIIPSYLVPHVETIINDNSTFTDAASTPSENGVRLLCVFASSKGEDGVIKPVRSLVDYIEEYGTPNYALYGQPCYMPYAALSTGNAKCYCLRVMPEDSAYANIAVCAYAKTITPVGEGAVNKLQVKFVAVPFTGVLNDRDALDVTLANMAKIGAEVTEDGYNVYPLFAACSKGKGLYGNGYRIRVVTDPNMNNENGFMNYFFEVLDGSTGSLLKKESHRGSFDPDALDGSKSMLFDDVMGDPDNGSNRIDVASYPAGFTALYNAYHTVFATAPAITECDLFTGLTKDTSAMANYEIDTTGVSLNTTVGIALANGSDGSFAADYVPTVVEGVSGPTRQESMDAMYISAFEGDIDPSITSKRRVPCELILDACYNEPVKLKLVELALKRYDARTIIDAGLLYTISAATSWAVRPTIKGIDNFTISKECQHYKIRDPYTNKIIPVTTTFFLAQNLPTHYRNFGNYVPFVSQDYAQLTGHIRNSLKPAIDADDLETKEILYTNRCNFIECIAEDTYVRAVQGTSQSVWSDLSEENNVAVILEMKRMLEEFVSARLYNFAEASDRLRFTEDADRMFSTFRNTKVRSFNVYFDMNAFEEERSILHCYLSVIFRTMAKRGIIEIDINKRV